MTQGIQKQRAALPAIEPERHFVQVSREVLGGNAVPRSDYASLQERERVLNGIGMNIAINIDLGLMLDGLVFVGQGQSLHCGRVGCEFIGHDYVNIRANIVADELRQSSALGILGMEETEFSAALPNADDYLLGGFAESRFVLVTTLNAANIGFVNFDSTIQHRAIYFLHGRTDAMAEVPSGFVAHAKSTFDLVCAHALACFTEQQCGKKPLLEGQVGVIEDRAGCNAKLIVAIIAVKELLLGGEFDGRLLATWALNPIGPAQAHEQFAAFVVGVEKVHYIN